MIDAKNCPFCPKKLCLRHFCRECRENLSISVLRTKFWVNSACEDDPQVVPACVVGRAVAYSNTSNSRICTFTWGVGHLVIVFSLHIFEAWDLVFWDVYSQDFLRYIYQNSCMISLGEKWVQKRLSSFCGFFNFINSALFKLFVIWQVVINQSLLDKQF